MHGRARVVRAVSDWVGGWAVRVCARWWCVRVRVRGGGGGRAGGGGGGGTLHAPAR
jgi:hypothetical protein